MNRHLRKIINLWPNSRATSIEEYIQLSLNSRRDRKSAKRTHQEVLVLKSGLQEMVYAHSEDLHTVQKIVAGQISEIRSEHQESFDAINVSIISLRNKIRSLWVTMNDPIYAVNSVKYGWRVLDVELIDAKDNFFWSYTIVKGEHTRTVKEITKN